MFLFYFVRNPFVLPAIYIYIKILAEGPGVARGKKTNKNKKMLKKKFQTIWSSRLAGYTQHICIRMSCFIT